MVSLKKMDFFNLPAVRMIGVEVSHKKLGNNPVPDLWKSCFQDGTFDELSNLPRVIDYYVGWMSDFDMEAGRYIYIAGYFLPAGTPVPAGFQYRDLDPCLVAMSYVYGDFYELFPRLHKLTLGGLKTYGYAPDYRPGWRAEVFRMTFSFHEREGTVNYIHPCFI